MASGKTHLPVNVTAMIVLGSLAAAYFIGEHSVGQWQSVGALACGYFLSPGGVHLGQDIAARTFSERSGRRGGFLHYWSLPEAGCSR